MSKKGKIFILFTALLLLFGSYRYKIFNDNKYKERLTYATNTLYDFEGIQKDLYDNYKSVYKEAISKNSSFNDIYSHQSLKPMKEKNLQLIKLLKQDSLYKSVLKEIENPRSKYKNQYNLFLEAHDYYTKNLNKFDLDPNTFKEADYDEFIKHFNELNLKLANLMKTLEMPEYDAYFK